MGFRLEPEFRAHLILQAFDCFILELHYLVTAGAYEVVVVLVAMDMLVMGVFLSEYHLSKMSALYEQGEGTVDGGLGDALMVLPEAQQQVFRLKVFVRIKHPAEDGLAFRGKFQALRHKIVLEPLFFYLYLFIRHGSFSL